MIALGWGMASAIGAIAGMLIAPVVFLEPNMMGGVLIYGFAAAVLGGLSSPFGAVIGDLLVQPASAHGRRRRHQHIPFPIEHGRSIGGLTHFHLVNHPRVWAQIRPLLRCSST